MLVYQGVTGFQLWTGKDPDERVMRQALLDAFAV
jgi:shikimate 5-dehydrogenase